MAAAKVRFSVVGFSHTAVLRLRLADLRREGAIPAVVSRGPTHYGTAFAALAEQIPADVALLKGSGYAVDRPAAFFLSDGRPTDGNRWRPVYQHLVDRRTTPAAPNIIACGIGVADAATILQVATRPDFAFVCIAGVAIGSAITQFASSLTKSVVASGLSLTHGAPELIVDKPEGFRMAIDVT
jgi:uncharacterized protein YegL